MDVEIKCQGCGRGLLVPDSYRGSQVECPGCHAISSFSPREKAYSLLPRTPVSGIELSVVPPTTTSIDGERPPAEATTVQATSDPPSLTFFMQTPEGQIFGPVSRETLASWVREGRVSHDCSLREQTGEWQHAVQWFPELREFVSIPHTVASVAVVAPIPSEPYQYLRPHRGWLVLILAVVGMAVWCPVLTIMAWVIGSGDLLEMDAGRIDPSGRQLTRWGKNLGMVMALGWIFAASFAVMILLYFSSAWG